MRVGLTGSLTENGDRAVERARDWQCCNETLHFDITAINDYRWGMHASRQPGSASITIRNLDPALKERLRVRAAQHGQSMEAEARRILQTALAPQGAQPMRHLYDRIRARFAPLGGVDLALLPRELVREPPQFD